jgi:2-oxoisovalerate dehydrogenase E1 component alpha subunit
VHVTQQPGSGFGPDLAEVFGPSQQDGGPELIQLLTPEGERVHHPEFDLDFSAEQLRGFYRDMVLTRRIDTEATALQRHGELGIWAQLLGQEAAQIGAGRALRPQDYVFPTYREHGVAWCRGIDPLHLLGLFRGVDHGAWDPKDFNFGLYTIVIGAQALHATGYAMGQRFEGRVGGDSGVNEATMCFFGDGATSQGDVHEGFVWASVYDAPLVFFCQNNQWAISEPNDRQTRVPLYRRAQGYGFPGIRVDGNDVLACLAVSRWALEECRSGNGPVLIEAFTYRMDAHTTSDDPSRYRLADELELWKLKDPLERVRVHLVRGHGVGNDFFDGLAAESDALAARLRAHCHALPQPGPERIFSHVYAEPSPELDAQRDAYLAYCASFDGGAR